MLLMRFRACVLQDWGVNAGRPDSQLLLAWFRLAQWAADHWGALAVVLDTVPAWGVVVGSPGRVIRVDERDVQR
jgi:hypothetical protein